MCVHFEAMCRGGGSSKPSSLLKGRAAGETPSAVIRRAMAMAPSSFFPDSSPGPHTYRNDSLSHVGDTVMCPVCTDILDKQIELECDRMVCLGCLVK